MTKNHEKFKLMDIPPTIPWHSPELWEAANASLARMLQSHRSALPPARAAADRIGERIRCLDAPMNWLCAQTCPGCKDICCLRAKVWYDFKDLLYLHLSGSQRPPGQLLAGLEQHCRYFTPRGCMLPRTQRPFVCTWYLCPRQKDIIHCTQPSLQVHLDQCLADIKADRGLMEMVLIQGVVDQFWGGNGSWTLSTTRLCGSVEGGGAQNSNIISVQRR